MQVGLYERMVERKKRGEYMDMKNVDYHTLYQLWWKEECSDKRIAELFDVPTKKITNLRHKWELKGPEILIKEFENRFMNADGTNEEPPQDKLSNRDKEVLLRKINELNDTDLETIRIELARRYEVFATVKHETEFFEAVERAIREFQ